MPARAPRLHGLPKPHVVGEQRTAVASHDEIDALTLQRAASRARGTLHTRAMCIHCTHHARTHREGCGERVRERERKREKEGEGEGKGRGRGGG
eukprot:6214811-Pleurochrysis_carterae.AAC.2